MTRPSLTQSLTARTAYSMTYSRHFRTDSVISWQNKDLWVKLLYLVGKKLVSSVRQTILHFCPSCLFCLFCISIIMYCQHPSSSPHLTRLLKLHLIKILLKGCSAQDIKVTMDLDYTVYSRRLFSIFHYSITSYS